MLKRRRDTAADGRGFVVPLSDVEIVEFLALIRDGTRDAIDGRLEHILRALVT
jgi:hypothetical protein